MHKFKVSIGAVCLAVALIATGVQADTYTVTQGSCAGSGSLREAIEIANANPGKDTVNFDASVTRVQPTSGSTACASPRSIQITESVDIIGPGTTKLTISDNVGWITPSGHLNGGLECDSGNVILADGDTPFVVEGDGMPEVTIKGVTFTKNSGVLDVRNKPAVVNFEDVVIRENYATQRTQCQGPAVSALGQLNMTNVAVFFNKMTNTVPRDAIVFVRGGARLEGTRFSSNRAGSQFFQLGDISDKIIIRESSFSSQQPRIVIAGSTAKIANTVIVGEIGGAGVQGFNAQIDLINSTISLPTQVTLKQGPSGALAGATHLWMEGSGNAGLFNTIIHGSTGSSSTYLPMVAASGNAFIFGDSDSHVTDGSGPVGPTSGDPNLSGNFVPLGPPTKNGGNSDLAIDPETFPPAPLATDLEGNPRIQGPAVDKGVYEIQENHTYDDSYVVNQNQLFISSPDSVLDNDVTIDPSAVRKVNITSLPLKGQLNMNTDDGTFIYQPATDDYGPRTFSYFMSATSTAGTTIANPATVTLNIQKPFPIDTQPDNYSINEGQTLVTTADNAPLVNDDLQTFIYMSALKGAIVKVIDPPDHAVPGGFVFPPDGIFSYTPEAGFSGTDTFTYEIFFEKLGTAGSAETLVTIEVLDTNKPPVAQDDAYSTQQGVGISISSPALLANDSDPDGNTLSAVKKSDPAHGTVSFFDGGAFTYFPDPASVGTDSFTYAASDGKAESNIATVTITLNPVNTPPIAQPDKYRIPAESLLSVPARGGVLRNDTDPDGDSLSVSVTTDPAHGDLTLHSDGSFSYLPDAGFSGIDTFEYLLSDGQDSVSGIVTLIVTPTNRPPVTHADAYSVVQDTKLVVPAPSFLDNDSDPEGHVLYITNIQAPKNGQYTFDASGAFIYTPNPGFTGDDVMSYIASDGELDSQVTSVTIQVTPAPVNAPPVAHNDSWSVPQDGFLDVPSPGVRANDNDPEGHALTVSFLTKPAAGTFTPGSGGAFTYRPPPGFSGQVSFTYKVSDGHSDSATATGIITVSAVNHAPVAHNDAYAMNAGLTLQVNAPGLTANDSDPDGDALTVILSGAPAHGLLSSDGKGGFEYSPESGFTGVDSFTYHVRDDGKLNSNEATVQITVSGFNRAPVAHDDAYSIGQGSLLMIDVKKGLLSNDTDADGNQLFVQVKSQPANGVLHQQQDGSFTYQPATGFNGTDSYTYLAYDGHEKSNLAKVTINVNAVNRAPLAADDSYTIASDTLLKVDVLHGLLINDADPEGDSLSAIIVGYPSKGDLHANADGSFTYNPNTGNNGRDTFTYKAKDGQLESNVATVTIDVHSTNQAPVANDDSYSVDQNTSLVVKPKGLLANDTDADGNTLRVVAGTGPTNGTLHLSLDGGFSYMPNADYAGQDSFTYKAFDGVDESDEATVTVEVNTSYQLRVNLTGQGRVTGGLTTRTVGSSIDCPGNCEASFPAGSTAGLFAELDNDVTQGSWSWAGVCPDDQAHCDYTMDADKVANVVFSCELSVIPKASIVLLEPDWVCYDLESSADGYEILGPEGEVTFRAQNSIMLRPGFKVGAGGIFHALISR